VRREDRDLAVTDESGVRVLEIRDAVSESGRIGGQAQLEGRPSLAASKDRQLTMGRKSRQQDFKAIGQFRGRPG